MDHAVKLVHEWRAPCLTAMGHCDGLRALLGTVSVGFEK